MTDSGATAPESGSGEEPVRFTVVKGNPSDAELAAVTAVVTAMAEEQGNEPAAGKSIRTAWAHSQRGIRRPFAPGAGAWNRQNL